MSAKEAADATNAAGHALAIYTGLENDLEITVEIHLLESSGEELI